MLLCIFGLDYGDEKAIILLLSVCIPVVNIISILIVNAQATTALRDAGLKVGIFGAT